MSIQAAEERESPSLAVIEAVADREGVDPTDLDRSLFEVIDPDALDAVIRSDAGGRAPSPLRVTFHYHGYEVTVSSDGQVELSRGQIGRT